MPGEWWIGKEREGSGHGVIKAISWNWHGVAEENHEKLGQDDRHPSQGSNWATRKYESTVLLLYRSVPYGKQKRHKLQHARSKWATCFFPRLQQQQSVGIRLQRARHDWSPRVVVHIAARCCRQLALWPTIRKGWVHRWAHPRYIDCSYNTWTDTYCQHLEN
jgi:hypothetical protein